MIARLGEPHYTAYEDHLLPCRRGHYQTGDLQVRGSLHTNSRVITNSNSVVDDKLQLAILLTELLTGQLRPADLLR